MAFPTTGRRAIAGSPDLRVTWSGAASDPINGINAFTINYSGDYSMTATCFGPDGEPGFEFVPDTVIVRIASTTVNYNISALTFDAVTGVLTFEVVPLGVLFPGTYLCHIQVIDNAGRRLSYPSIPTVVTVLEA